MTSASAEKIKRPAARSVGRPRRLKLDQVLDAALELGLDDLTMAAVANRLGVGVAVLYNYVKNREELLRTAAIRAAHRHSLPKDTGQHWSQYAADYACGLYEMLTSDTQLIHRFMEGGLGPEVQIDQAEAWLAALTARGFPPREALKLLRIVGQLVVGCAVTAAHTRALNAAGTSYAAAARKAVGNRSEDEIPLLKQYVKTFAEDARYAHWKESLRLVLESVAASRGETLPEQSRR